MRFREMIFSWNFVFFFQFPKFYEQVFAAVWMSSMMCRCGNCTALLEQNVKELDKTQRQRSDACDFKVDSHALAFNSNL